MTLKSLIRNWFIPPGFTRLIRKQTKIKDINEFISPVQLRHLFRYNFAKDQISTGEVLDAACGSGYGSEILLYDHYFGIDYADYNIKYAEENYYQDDRSFIEKDIYLLSDLFEGKRFDSIISFETLEHLDNPVLALQVFDKILKPGGKIVASIPLNHPDVVYHKRIYNHKEIYKIMVQTNSMQFYHVEEFLQSHLCVKALTELLPDNVKGTWLGVLTKNTPNS